MEDDNKTTLLVQLEDEQQTEQEIEPVLEYPYLAYKSVDLGSGYKQRIHLPWWVSEPSIKGRFYNPEFGMIHADDCNNKEEEITFRCNSVLDRRHLARVVDHTTVLELAVAMFLWAPTDDDLHMVTMYCTDNPLQMYCGIKYNHWEKLHKTDGYRYNYNYCLYSSSLSYQRAVPYDQRYILTDLVKKIVKYSEKPWHTLNSGTRILLTKLVSYLQTHSTRLHGTVREEGFALIRRIFLCQEVRLPVAAPSLSRIALVTVVTNIQQQPDGDGLSSLSKVVPPSVYRLIEEMYNTIGRR